VIDCRKTADPNYFLFLTDLVLKVNIAVVCRRAIAANMAINRPCYLKAVCCSPLDYLSVISILFMRASSEWDK
jgi:hypothetical protein